MARVVVRVGENLIESVITRRSAEAMTARNSYVLWLRTAIDYPAAVFGLLRPKRLVDVNPRGPLRREG